MGGALTIDSTTQNNAINAYIHASTTIPKTHTNNTFSGTNTFNSTLTVGTYNGPLQANNGVVSATTSIGVLYGGTGWTNIQANTLLLGNGTGALATTSAGTNGYVLALVGGVPTWQATTTLSTISGTLGIAKGGTNSTSFTTGKPIYYDGTSLVSTTSLTTTVGGTGLTTAPSYGTY